MTALSETTLAHLRDEAYAFLAQQALEAKLRDLETERAAVESTRSPFGVLARRATREKFAHSMQVIADNETVLRDQLAQITGIVDWLHPIIRKDVSTYLASVSPDYCQMLQVVARIDDWGRSYAAIKELLGAFARDLHGLRLALAAARKDAPFAGRELAVLRVSAERLGGQQYELQTIQQAAQAIAPATVGAVLAFPTLPDLQRVAWVSRLAVLPAPQALAEVKQVEADVRAFLAGPCDQVPGDLNRCREICGQQVVQILDGYWNELRAHARQHYVEPREVSEIIEMLSQQYIDAGRRRRQQPIGVSNFSG